VFWAVVCAVACVLHVEEPGELSAATASEVGSKPFVHLTRRARVKLVFQVRKQRDEGLFEEQDSAQVHEEPYEE
jgi:hypothetical protein